ncbi:rCG44344 [Rattus norvegicus]|uniref:RCG44344 n=1 Tax=Rattus norvegicus TaxID=10116 RepID=A6KD70_RAT|nr:rCG44344 [Rattus norvegicus]
MNRCPQTDRAL